MGRWGIGIAFDSESNDLDIGMVLRQAGQVVWIMGGDESAAEPNGGGHDKSIYRMR